MPCNCQSAVTPAHLLEDVINNWNTEQWDKHFADHGRRSAGRARYCVNGNNDVVKHALIKVHGASCWYQGSATCRSRAVLARDLQVDHIVPKKADMRVIQEALGGSLTQSLYFDVHDPGNLAPICGPCNQERPKNPERTAAVQDRQLKAEKHREQVIHEVEKWHANTGIDKASLSALTNADISEDETWEVLAEMMASLIQKRAVPHSSKSAWRLVLESSVVAQSESYKFTLELSDNYIQAIVDELADMEFEERRIERYFDEG